MVVPENWIKNIGLHLEKFLNNSLNSSQEHICYWTNSVVARNHDEILRLDFPPNFNLPLSSNFPADGCYLCRLTKAKCKSIKILYNISLIGLLSTDE